MSSGYFIFSFVMSLIYIIQMLMIIVKGDYHPRRRVQIFIIAILELSLLWVLAETDTISVSITINAVQVLFGTVYILDRAKSLYYEMEVKESSYVNRIWIFCMAMMLPCITGAFFAGHYNYFQVEQLFLLILFILLRLYLKPLLVMETSHYVPKRMYYGITIAIVMMVLFFVGFATVRSIASGTEEEEDLYLLVSFSYLFLKLLLVFGAMGHTPFDICTQKGTFRIEELEQQNAQKDDEELVIEELKIQEELEEKED